jgi:hypothetical protein
VDALRASSAHISSAISSPIHIAQLIDVSLSDWIAHTPPEMAAQKLNLSTDEPSSLGAQAGNRADVKDAQIPGRALFQNAWRLATARSQRGDAALHRGTVPLLGIEFKQ